MRNSIILALALAGGACGGGEEQTAITPMVPVEAAVVRRDTLPDELVVTGRLVPPPGAMASLSAPADAVVRTVAVQVGEEVRQGQPLLELDAPQLAANVISLRAAADAAEREAARQEKLLEDGIAARRSVEEARAAAERARADAGAAAELAGRLRITSPLGGRVQRMLVNPGEQVAAGTRLAEIVRPGPVDMIAPVSPADLGRLTPGMPAQITSDAMGGSAAARVHAVAPAVDPVTGSGTVILRTTRAGLLPGAGATAVIRTGVHAGVLVVPDSSLVLVGDSLSVFIIQPDSTVRRVSVRVQARARGLAGVSGEVQEGDRVVGTGSYGLADGMRVRVVP
ncbi:MAG: efflux RND transporter periplasmic adaptor subunit [Gemmatimonadales bacterium]